MMGFLDFFSQFDLIMDSTKGTHTKHVRDKKCTFMQIDIVMQLSI